LILLTTSDYFPQLGGLSTFTKNIETVLKEMNLDYELFHWKSIDDIKSFSPDRLSSYTTILNIHPQFAWLSDSNQDRMINFIHGSEILMVSPNPLKKIYKKLFSGKFFEKLSRSYLNVFISEATMKKATEKGFKVDYSRDIVLHNCIDVKDAVFVKKELKNKLVFSCIVRNVPHKNLHGSVKFCEYVAAATGKQVELVVPKNSNLTSTKIEIKELPSAGDSDRDEAYRSSHFNLLLSLDHSDKGFYEGFGLTVLEAARFGTPSIVMNSGGLPEAVHHGETGWVIDSIDALTVEKIFSREEISNYQQMAINCYGHTVRSHTLAEYSRLMKSITSQRYSA
jgi:glycosyltransferase involved in cell wall biosynthesis